MKYVTINLFQSAQSILTQFSGSLQKRALDNFKATGVDVRLGVAVTKVTRDELTIKVKGEDKEEVVPYGICVWSTGTGKYTSQPQQGESKRGFCCLYPLVGASKYR